MNIGDLVEPNTIKGKQDFVSGSYRYPDAVVVSLDPFVLVSWEADMLWNNEKEENFKVKRQAPTAIFSKCLDRFKRDESRRSKTNSN